MQSEPVEAFWREYLATLPPDSPVRGAHYETGSFGDTPEPDDELGALITNGTKTATCSALWEYEVEDEPLHEPGAKCVALNGQDDPPCVIETIEVEVRPYNEVDAHFAHDEGEGDRSLEHCRDMHWRFFTRSLSQIGREPTPEMPLVCERFQVVHRR